MTDPRNISIQDYTYTLPDERIAKYPLSRRDDSHLLIYKEGKISEDLYRNITKHIPEDSLLVFNNTKVVEARLVFQKPSGGQIEIFCLGPADQSIDITTAMMQTGKVQWQCLIGGMSKWKTGQSLEKEVKITDRSIMLQANYIEKKSDSFIIELSWSPPDLSFAELLHCTGAIPLPPYIKRKVQVVDTERYQTVYAHFDGSVAAPTAGLHFTDNIFKSLEEKKIQTDFVTLHVGAGTFKPVKTALMQEHAMHAEWINVPKKTIENILNNIDNNIVAVGTTSMRTIESLYWLSRKTERCYVEPDQPSGLHLSQWEAYELADKNVTAKDALQNLLEWMNKNKLESVVATTQILIAPGYECKIVKGLITNFHQPQSTLLLLVAALIGEGWEKVYDHALQNEFRFLSYGDGCLLWKD